MHLFLFLLRTILWTTGPIRLITRDRANRRVQSPYRAQPTLARNQSPCHPAGCESAARLMRRPT